MANAARSSSGVQRWVRAVILLVGGTTMLCFLALSPILRAWTKRDRDSGAPRTATATVEQIVPPHLEENSKPVPTQVWVRVNGSLAASEAVFGSARLRVGGPARVTYRVGRSGRIYVDRVEPLPEPRAADRSP
jgi:hypothetical protein